MAMSSEVASVAVSFDEEASVPMSSLETSPGSASVTSELRIDCSCSLDFNGEVFL